LKPETHFLVLLHFVAFVAEFREICLDLIGSALGLGTDWIKHSSGRFRWQLRMAL